MEAYLDEILQHYESIWRVEPVVLKPMGNRTHELPDNFRILEYDKTENGAWVYATVGMSQPNDSHPLEVHLLSPERHRPHVDLLAMVAHFHRTGEVLGHNHTVNFGLPWMPGSECDCGLLSPPYLDGRLMLKIKNAKQAGKVTFAWLMPITQAERAFAVKQGLEQLWDRFEDAATNPLDATRRSVV